MTRLLAKSDVLICLVGTILCIAGCFPGVESSRLMLRREGDGDSSIVTRNLQAAGENDSIPHIFYFTHKVNVLETRSPRHVFDNVMETLKQYSEFWGEPDAPVHFLDNDRCRSVIDEMDPRMVKYFDEEEDGRYKADICRIAALWFTGGYYFDVDINVVEPFRPPAGANMASILVEDERSVFQAFIAVSKEHPLMRVSMNEMHRVYSEGLDRRMVGPFTMKKAYDGAPQSVKDKVYFMEEVRLDQERTMYPAFPRAPGQSPCNWVCHSKEEKKIYFYARMCCMDESGKIVLWKDTDQCVPFRPIEHIGAAGGDNKL